MNHTEIQRQPTLYIPHGGGPCFFMDWNPPDTWDRMADFLRGVVATLPARPRAVLLISGHWLASAFTIGSSPKPSLIYDYYGFPEHTYQIQYGADGDPALALRVRALLNEQGLPAADDAQRGYDHGVFIPLKLMLPDADIPVAQLSLLDTLDPVAHLAAGRALTPLRDDGVLIVGSGMSFHNMQAYGDPRFGPVSDTFDAWLSAAIAAPPAERHARLSRWDEAPAARLSHPPGAAEHLLPLMVAAGAAGEGHGRRIFSDRVMQTTISAFRFD
ncbi:MAG TPA: class III extradiol ring-cleavage dioxygenase [Solimonas sp.]